MDRFKDYLQKEGVKVDWVTFKLQTREQFGKAEGLKILKKHNTAGEFQYSDQRPELAEETRCYREFDNA